MTFNDPSGPGEGTRAERAVATRTLIAACGRCWEEIARLRKERDDAIRQAAHWKEAWLARGHTINELVRFSEARDD